MKSRQLAGGLAALMLVLGCEMREARVSTDAHRLRTIVDFDLAFSNARWEVFATPEYSGGLPSPTDFLTLIVEFEASELAELQKLKYSDGPFFVVPTADRRWLNSPFREILVDGGTDMRMFPRQFNCSRYQTTIANSTRITEGFLCRHGSIFLLYLTLADNTRPQRATKTQES